MNTTLRLSDILARSLPVEWFEAVALVRDVADRVRDSLSGSGVPELHQIELSPEGHVSLTGAARTDEPVRRLGQLLQASLVMSDPPVQLRLAVSQATAPTPAFASVREYSEALAYFERPDRPAVLRALYERASAAPAGDVQVTPTLDTIAPLELPKPRREPARTPEPERQRARRALPVMAAVVVLIVGSVTYWQFAAAAPSTARVSAAAVKASDVVGTALVSGISAVTDSVGLGRLAPVEGSGAVPAALPPVEKASVPVRTPRPKPAVPRTVTSPTFKLFDLAPDVVVGLPIARLPPTVIPAPTAISTAGYRVDETVYSADDADVVAPVGVRPQLPAVLPASVRRDQLTQIELLVLPDGTVGAVKLLGSPRSVLEGMLLSAAKAWKFNPATKDGRPVAYRKLVWLVLE